MANKPMQRCGAHSRRTGQPCRNIPVGGKKRCRMHGGAPGSGHKAGPTHPRWKHGLRSQNAAARRRLAREVKQFIDEFNAVMKNRE